MSRPQGRSVVEMMDAAHLDGADKAWEQAEAYYRAVLVQAVENVKAGRGHIDNMHWIPDRVLREFDRLTGTTDSAPLDDVYEKMLVMGRANRRQHKDGTTDRSEGDGRRS